MSRLRIGELFAGYGGLGMGVQQAIGGDVVWVSEFDKGANKILAHRFPDVPNHGDITEIDWLTVESVDVLTGGFPCQDLSHAGKRAGMVNGSRSNLWHEFVRAIAHLQPSLVVIENVRGLLSGSGEFDEPDDLCVCGWPYRRGGVRADPEHEGHVPPPCDGGHDGESNGGPRGHAGEVWGAHQDGPCRDGEVGCGLCLDGCWAGCDGAVAGRSATPDLEDRAGAHRVEGRRDQGESSEPLGGQGGQPAQPSMDRRGAGAVRDIEAQDARAECEGTDGQAFDITTGRRITHCEACGGPLGNRPDRHVERSWMGIVQRELARLGYDAQWHGLRAADIGAPHGRFRVFVVAYPTSDTGRVHHRDLRPAADAIGRGRDGRPPQPLRGPLRRAAAAGSREVSALLPSPAAYDGERGGSQDPAKRLAGGHSVTLQDAVYGMLPTPQARDWKGFGPADADRHDPNLSAITHLLPTPRALDATGVCGVTPNRTDAANARAGETLTDVGRENRWGQYAAAIARWEHLTGPAPAPTELGPKGGPRLSAAFSEWLMGVPAGWVTDVPGITRNEALKALGNGVVPAQAAAALRLMLGSEVAA